MIPFEAFITFIMASSLLCLSPGPDNIFVLTQSALYGKKSGIFVTLGLCTGLLFHTTAVALGVAAIFKTSAFAFTILKFAGASYLLYLAWQALRASPSKLESHKAHQLSVMKLYRRGIIMNITNPKVSIFFLAFLPQFASPAYGPITQQIFILGISFIFVSLFIFCLIALLAGTLGHYLNSSPKIQTYINRIAGIVFIGLAMKLATSSMQTN